MPVCNVQRHLIGAGARITADGTWGTQSKTAMVNFVRDRPLAESTAVHPSGLPSFGSRSDYKFEGQKLRIPAAYVTAFPPMANVACRTGATNPLVADLPTSPSDVIPWVSERASSAAASPWPWVVAAALAGGAGYWWWKKTRP